MEVLAITGEVVVAGGGTKRHRSRAGAAVLADGSLFVAYRVGRNMFEESHGAVVATRSADGGDTWEEPAPLLAEPSWDWFGAQRLLQLDDGMLLMLAGKARWNSDRFHTYAVRSSDGGRTWDPLGPEIRVFASFSEPYGQGAVRGLPEGRLLLGFQGSDTPGEPNLAAVAFSRDRGATWSERVLLSDDAALELREPDTLPLPDGRLLTVLRTDAPPYASYQCYSEDAGRSWTPLTATGFHGHCPRLFALRRRHHLRLSQHGRCAASRHRLQRELGRRRHRGIFRGCCTGRRVPTRVGPPPAAIQACCHWRTANCCVYSTPTSWTVTARSAPCAYGR